MNNFLFLRTLCTQKGDAVFDKALDAFFQDQLTRERIDELIDECIWREALMSPHKAIENWKVLLSVNLLNHFHAAKDIQPTPGHHNVHFDRMRHKVYEFERHPWNQSSQYFRVIVAVNHLLANLPVPDVSPDLLKGGAALIELQEYCPWLALPSIPHHLEFGIFLCALARLSKKDELKEKVIALAEWQINTLDANGIPFSGLFVKEADNEVQRNLVLYYLLFKGVGGLTSEAKYQNLAHTIQRQIKKSESTIEPLWILLEQLFSSDKQGTSIPATLPEMIYDPSTALMGYRSRKQHAVCTLHGNKTGLGTFRYEDIEIVNYGPQYLPLGECQGFGIEGNHFSDHGERLPILQNISQGFILKGCTRMIDQPAAGNQSFFSSHYRGIWLEVTQEFKLPSFHLQTTLLGLDGWEGVAFSFFVKAKKCHVEKKEILPRSFDRYEGAVQDVILDGEKMRYALKSPDSKASMQIIPLSGGQDFWGADFLVAYLFHPDQRHYEWQLNLH